MDGGRRVVNGESKQWYWALSIADCLYESLSNGSAYLAGSTSNMT